MGGFPVPSVSTSLEGDLRELKLAVAMDPRQQSKGIRALMNSTVKTPDLVPIEKPKIERVLDQRLHH